MMFFERYAKSSYIYKQQMYEMGNVFLRGNKRIFYVYGALINIKQLLLCKLMIS